jgi:hypothetical protein
MKTLLLIAALMVLTGTAFSQDTPPVTDKPNMNPVKPFVPIKLLSAHPTTQEIIGVLAVAGTPGVEPVEIVQELVAAGPSVVTALASLITPDTVACPLQPTDSVGVVKPRLANRVLAVYALDAIGSQDAYAAIMQIGAIHKEIEIRAASLNALSHGYLDKVRPGALKADKGVIYIFLKNVDDPTEVPSLRLSIAQIAREGMRRWLNWDLGVALQSQYRLVINKASTIMSSPEYWDYWWKLNSPKIVWAANSGQFQISK